MSSRQADLEVRKFLDVLGELGSSTKPHEASFWGVFLNCLLDQIESTHLETNG